MPLDIKVTNQEKTKVDTYTPFIVGLLLPYPEYSYEVVPIVVGATGLITDSPLVTKLQTKALIGSIRVLKSAHTVKQS